MGIIEFFLLILIVAFLCYITIFILGKMAPTHPPMIDNIIWFIGVLIILIGLANALGLTGYDPKIPRLR